VSARTALFAITVFVSSSLLFVVQPMIAKMVLPLLGGAPAVWNGCMVFFQACLLIGYAYAHFSTRWLGAKPQAAVHLLILLSALLFLPFSIPSGWTPPAEANPVGWLLKLLFAGVALPFAIVSTTAPLAQKWFVRAASDPNHEPYFLYSASNIGSMLALLSYPALVEPHLNLHAQTRAWEIGYAALIVLTAFAAAMMWRGRTFSRVETAAAAAVTWRQRLWWIILAAIPTSYLLGVTSYITSDLAAVPLLWVIPLALYLLSFIIVFSRRPILPQASMVKLLPPAIVFVVLWMLAGITHPLWLVMIVHLLAFFIAAMVCHGELVVRRPPAEHLTEFYLMMSIGGVIGGMFNALLAPVLFNSTAEYPLIIVLVSLIYPSNRSTLGQTKRTIVLDIATPLVVGVLAALLLIRFRGRADAPFVAAVCFMVPMAIALTAWKRPLRFALCIAAALAVSGLIFGAGEQVLAVRRSFFGVHRLARDAAAEFNELYHGTTLHGRQFIDPQTHRPILPRQPLTYYHRTGPIGQVMLDLISPRRTREAHLNLAFVGLGTGSLAAYGESGDEMTCYEIDPLVAWFAERSGNFTFLSDARSRGVALNIVLGDARLTIQRAPQSSFDLIVLDAFSGDAIPVHLLTRQAMQIYLDKLKPDGLLAFHISNQYLDLRPVVANLADSFGCVCVARFDDDIKPFPGKERSLWLLVMRDIRKFAPLASDARWLQIPKQNEFALWTDEYSNIVSLMRWGRDNSRR
jgi:spermidine synthase